MLPPAACIALGLMADGSRFADDERGTTVRVSALGVVARHARMRQGAGRAVARQRCHDQAVLQSHCAYAQGFE